MNCCISLIIAGEPKPPALVTKGISKESSINLDSTTPFATCSTGTIFGSLNAPIIPAAVSPPNTAGVSLLWKRRIETTSSPTAPAINLGISFDSTACSRQYAWKRWTSSTPRAACADLAGRGKAKKAQLDHSAFPGAYSSAPKYR